MLQENKARQIFWKKNICHALFSCNTRFEICPFALLPTKYFQGRTNRIYICFILKINTSGTNAKFFNDIISWAHNPAGNYVFQVNNRNIKTRREICSKLTIKTPERRYWRRSDVFIANFEDISHLVLVFPLLTLSR